MTEIIGTVFIEEDVVVNAPLLTKIHGDLTVAEGSRLVAPNLGLVDGDLSLSKRSSLISPNLTHIGELGLFEPTAVLEAGITHVHGHRVADPETCKKRLAEIAELVWNNPEQLDMRVFHNTCGTAHCIAGWAEELYGRPTVWPISNGAIHLGLEAASKFYMTHDDEVKEAKEWLLSH